MTAQSILSLIETVEPRDTAKLDEIDMAAFRYVTGYTGGFEGGDERVRQRWYARCAEMDPVIGPDWRPIPQYTRSRDALKAIRPEGWEIRIFVRPDGKHNECFAGQDIMSKFQPTEELAELHAVLQAIEHERNAT